MSGKIRICASCLMAAAIGFQDFFEADYEPFEDETGKGWRRAKEAWCPRRLDNILEAAAVGEVRMRNNTWPAVVAVTTINGTEICAAHIHAYQDALGNRL